MKMGHERFHRVFALLGGHFDNQIVVFRRFCSYQPFDLLLVGTIPFGLAFLEIPKLFLQGKAERNVFAFAVFRNSEH